MFQLLPLIVIFPLVYSANVSFPLLKDSPILRDDPLDSRPNAKVFLKNRLLDNLNNFFGSETAGALEILDSNPQKIEEDEEIPPSLPIKPTNIPSMKSGGRVIKRMDNFVHRFPTLVPTEATEPPIVTTTINMPPKNRSEGRMLSEKSIESIREWRKRLYKAFKWKKAKDLGGPGERKLAKNDQAVEKNRQLIESRREPPRHQPPHLILDKNGRLLGTETSGYKAADVSSQVARNPLPLPDHPPISSSLDSPSEFQGKRQAYRTPGHQAVVFLPAPPAPEYHQPFSQHIVTATAPPLPTLPPMITFPPQTAANLIHEYQYSTPAAPSSQQFSSLTNNQNNRFEEESQTEDDMFGSSVAMNTDCQDGMCQTSSNGQVVSEEKCNSNRLRTIIQNNIVANDAEASKRAVQTAAEAETGSYFDAVCGTGFFSYIAHTDEFCLASSAGVNCYVFSPVCADSASGTMFGVRRRTARKVLLNRN